MVRQNTPSALIVDSQFPGSPGCDLCRELMQAAPTIPFVVLSASPSIVDKVFFLEMGEGPIPIGFFESLVTVRDFIVHSDNKVEWEFSGKERPVADQYANLSSD